jgi:general secretion pathway protein I
MARTDQNKAGGFTLIEVLVALAIAALGLALLFAATGSGLESVTAADRYVQATGHAQSRLAWVGRALPLRKGDYSGEEGDGFHWHVRIADPASHQGTGPQAQALAIYPITVTESWQSGVSQKRVSLYSERVGPL